MGNKLTSAQCSNIFKATGEGRLRALSSLFFGNNSMGSTGAISMTRFYFNYDGGKLTKKLRTLDLEYNDISLRGIIAISKAIETSYIPSIKVLRLSNNNLRC